MKNRLKYNDVNPQLKFFTIDDVLLPNWKWLEDEKGIWIYEQDDYNKKLTFRI